MKTSFGEPVDRDDLFEDELDEAIAVVRQAFPGSEIVPGQASFVFKDEK